MAEPNLTTPLTDKLEPTVAWCTQDNAMQDPDRRIPTTDTMLPSRAKLRNEIVDAKFVMSKTEICEESLANDRRDMVDPRSICSNTDMVMPARALGPAILQ
jgi:hypothetical protein